MAVNVNVRRNIEPLDIVNIMTDPPSVMEISSITDSGTNTRIYVRTYLIRPEGLPVMSIEYNDALNKWVLPYDDPNIEVVFHRKPEFPESDEALTYLREFVTGDLFGSGVSISDDELVYGDSTNRNDMIESAMKYWQKMIFNDELNTYVKSLVENDIGIGGIPIMYRDGANNLVILPEYVESLKKIHTYLYGHVLGSDPVTNEEVLELARKIYTVKNEYMTRSFVPVKSAMKR